MNQAAECGIWEFPYYPPRESFRSLPVRPLAGRYLIPMRHDCCVALCHLASLSLIFSRLVLSASTVFCTYAAAQALEAGEIANEQMVVLQRHLNDGVRRGKLLVGVDRGHGAFPSGKLKVV